jgi:hypothetical protein
MKKHKVIKWVDRESGKYPYKLFTNIEKEYKGFKSLPKNGYPYTFEFEETENRKYVSKPITGHHTFETCGSKDNPHMNGIIIKGTFEEAKTKLQELRKEDNTIGLK